MMAVVVRCCLLLAICASTPLVQIASAQSDRDLCFKSSGDQAIAACTRAIKSNPRDAYSYTNRGHEWTQKGAYEKAISDLTEAIKINPSSATAYEFRGIAWGKKNNIERAIEDFNQAIKLNPNDPVVFNRRGIAWSDKYDFDRAIADYNEAIRLNPKHTRAYYNRGKAWEAKNQPDRALPDFKMFAELDPEDKDGPRAVSRVEARLKGPSAQNVNAPPTRQQDQQALVQPDQRAPEIRPQPPIASSPERRVALIIGNAKYRHASALVNPLNDALLLANSLRNVGFQSVTVKHDLSRDQTIDALREFATLADHADWAVVYYSGHGIEFGGNNYLIPIDAQLRADRDVELETVDVGKILISVEGAKRLRLVILDACRDNPFASQMRRTLSTRSIGRGLARVEPEAGTLIVYAAKHGETALDGDGRNSPFAEALAKRMQQKPPQEIRRLFDIVRDDVLASTRKRQQPFSYGSLSGNEDFYFTR